jgi:hypothetical protein
MWNILTTMLTLTVSSHGGKSVRTWPSTFVMAGSLIRTTAQRILPWFPTSAHLYAEIRPARHGRGDSLASDKAQSRRVMKQAARWTSIAREVAQVVRFMPLWKLGIVAELAASESRSGVDVCTDRGGRVNVVEGGSDGVAGSGMAAVTGVVRPGVQHYTSPCIDARGTLARRRQLRVR